MRVHILVSNVFFFTGACASDHGVPRASTIRGSLNTTAGRAAEVAITRFAPRDWTELFVFSQDSSSEVIAR